MAQIFLTNIETVDLIEASFQSLLVIYGIPSKIFYLSKIPAKIDICGMH